MTNHKLQNDLERLRNEINHVAVEDVETRKKLNQIISDLEAKLETEDEENDGLMQDIREAIERFETEHPRATAILNDIMVTLSNMGI
jgi:uncharacterized membrane-anchored protein YjiN (DUF445 family)